MDVSSLIRQRLRELGLVQKDLAAAAEVTDSYISQLLTRKKAPPAPERTDLYEKIGTFLELPQGQLSKLADVQRRQELKKKIAEPPIPLLSDCRELILRKCAENSRAEVRQIFEKEPFGELERLVSQKILEAAQIVAREELRSEEWLRAIADVAGRTYEQVRVEILEFLDSDIFHISIEGCVSFLDPTIDSWYIDLRTFSLEIVVNRRIAPGGVKRFEFVERPSEPPLSVEAGFEQFFQDKSLSGNATEEEIEILKMLKFNGRRPSPLYYYRELQSLRDPLHFPDSDRTADSN